MKHTIVALSVLAAALGTAACGLDASPRSAVAAPGPSAPKTEAARKELSFLVGMIPHHAQAVDMAKVGLARSSNPRVAALCKAVVEVQSREIATMRSWAVEWYATVPSEVVSALHSAEGEEGEGGMLDDETMASLAALTGPAFDKAFARHMTAHHVGAVASARAIRDVAPHAEVRELADAIIAAQTDEIATMAGWARA